ncbi:MAG: bifunctional hydroxymethylpyrimidine kinase/phosphomethylpyrimidine kinase [Spirochaetia bacterium]|nr:bifunctional hydroxymethylpyrimidine kinase/phosphomethylpyrimidine kinase [Spirochaetia bacterium]
MHPVTLSIAGSDSGGGAGIQADLKTFQALGCFGTTAITAITCQNTLGVTAIHGVPPEIVRGQIKAVLDDFPVRAIKTGMLFSAEIIEVLEACIPLRDYIALVVDPVMVASSGARLLAPEAESALKRFLKRATIITPNVPEAEVLLGRQVFTLTDMEQAAIDLHAQTSAAVIVKGGHRAEHDKIVRDVFFDGNHVEILEAPLMDARHTHGTGCTLSAGIASGLSHGMDLLDAVKLAKEFLIGAIATAPGLGGGTGPLNHLWKMGK